MRYRCEDLEKYCMELDMTKSTILLLNKSDLLPLDIRTAWADFLDDLGVEYVFWSAVRAMEDVEWEKAVERATSMGLPVDPKTESDYLAKLAKRREDESESDARTRILDRDTLIELLEQRAIKALKAAGPEDPRNQEAGRRRVVGLIGYPNVGKSSTINALFGGKKTAVAPTPGKTKHFQTLIIHETMMFCDAPGLVFPTYAHSKAEMVAAGVIPIDRLTEVRTPVQIVASRVGRIPFERLYGCKFPPSVSLENPSAGEVLRGLCVLRGWVNGSGLPDETRGGRQILKGKIHCSALLLSQTKQNRPSLTRVDVIRSSHTRITQITATAVCCGLSTPLVTRALGTTASASWASHRPPPPPSTSPRPLPPDPAPRRRARSLRGRRTPPLPLRLG